MKSSTAGVAVSLLIACCTQAGAHHSFVGFYDLSRIEEIEGRVLSVSWRNPHGSMVIEVTADDGSTTDWQIETGSISVLRVRGIDREVVKVGDLVRIAGEPSLRRKHGLYARNLLLPSGEEFLLSIGVEPHWSVDSDATLAEPQFDDDIAATAREAADGLFRVWSTVFEDPNSFPMFKGGYPLTQAASAIKAQWDPDSVIERGCAFKGMPSLMVSPYPMEIVDRGDRIEMRFEEEDAIRTIHMRAEALTPQDFESIYGFSRGHWDGDALVIETDSISAELFDYDGTPQSAQARYVERLELSADESRLNYRITVMDPITFTETFELSRYFVWRPELVVNPYDCRINRE